MRSHRHEPVDTETLIRRLAADARLDRPGRPIPATRLPVAVGLALAASVVIVVLVAGPRPDLSRAAGHWIVQSKLIAALLAIFGAASLVRASAIPGCRLRPLPLLAPLLLFLLANLLLDHTAYPVFGAHRWSVPICVGTIVLASVPALFAVLATVRRGIPTRPAAAGGLSGLLAGSIGALAYCLACVNDGALFVTVWYGAALALVSALGALVGRRVLAW